MHDRTTRDAAPPPNYHHESRPSSCAEPEPPAYLLRLGEPEELDPVCTLEFAAHSRAFDHELRAARRTS